MSFFMSIFLGLVQGIAEFLPVSSSGHLSILQNIFRLNYNDQDHLLFDVMLHLGTMISICVYYRKDLKAILNDSMKFVKDSRKGSNNEDVRLNPSVRTVIFIIVGTLPLLVMLPFYNMIALLFYNTAFVGFALVITGTILYFSDKLIPGRKSEKTITVRDALTIGLVQACALLPGLSRSGTTVSIGMARGLSREFAIRFSLLLSLPAVLGASIISLIKSIQAGIEWSMLPVYIVGTLFAAVAGYFAIRLLNYISEKGKFGKFSYYCWALGGLTIFLSIIL